MKTFTRVLKCLTIIAWSEFDGIFVLASNTIIIVIIIILNSFSPIIY